MSGLKHVHRYEKTTLGRNKWPIHRCNLPDCNHYVASELVIGKFSICHRCGEKFIISKPVSRLAKPHCMKCIERKVKPEVKQLVDKMFNDLNLEELLTPESESLEITSNIELRNDESDEFESILSSMITK